MCFLIVAAVTIPTIEGPGILLLTVGVPTSFNLTVTDGDNDPIVVTANFTEPDSSSLYVHPSDANVYIFTWTPQDLEEVILK